MDFKLVKGGADAQPDYIFIKAVITDTRLMGVVGMHQQWRPRNVESSEFDLHLFYYFDIEELGLDQLVVYRGNSSIAIEITKETLFGGLGANNVKLTEIEARYLANFFVSETKRMNEKLPDTVGELAFINDVELSYEEHCVLMRKMCVARKTDYATCHYFLMRIYGHDLAGANFLAGENPLSDRFKDLQLPNHCTFLQNKVTEIESDAPLDGTRHYACESLVEQDRDCHYIVLTNISIFEGQVVGAEERRRFPISDIEASLKLRQCEFVSVYEIMEELRTEFDDSFATYSLGCTTTAHECGNMYMRFRSHNGHVEKPVFKLSDDVDCIFFVTDFGQLIAASYNQSDIIDLEAEIAYSPISDYCYQTGRYKFINSVVYDFAQSGFDDFEAFVSAIEEE